MTSVQAATDAGPRRARRSRPPRPTSPGHKAGEVVKQSVAPGTEVGKDAVVELTVATGLFPIPKDLVGKSYDDAAAALEALGLKATRSQEFNNDVDSDTVLSVNPSDAGQARRHDHAHRRLLVLRLRQQQR